MTIQLIPQEDDQFNNLQILVKAHLYSSEDVARSALQNKKLIEGCIRQIKSSQASYEKISKDVNNLDQILCLMELEKEVDENLIQNLLPSPIPHTDACENNLFSNGFIFSGRDILNELLTDTELSTIERHLGRLEFERLRWTKGDYIAIAISTLIGIALDTFNMAWRVNSPIDRDGKLRRWFNDKLHHHPSNNPIDYQGQGFGGNLHRVRSRGHDLTRFFDAIRQTSEGEFSGTRWSYSKPIEVISSVNQFGVSYPSMDWISAFMNVSVHLFGDFFSALSLPLPLSSVVYENCGREMRKLVHELYENGFSLRHITLNSIELLLSYLSIEVWLWMQNGFENRKKPVVQLKKYEMRSAVTGLLSGWNIGGCILFENPFLLNIPMLIAAVDSAAKLVAMKIQRDSWVRKETRNIQELVEAWESMAQAVRQDNATALIVGY